jgi:hypothetical protein
MIMNEPINVLKMKQTDLEDILVQKTNNPVAEMEIPKLLADIIGRGGKVVVVDELVGKERKLGIVDGKFILEDA